MPPTAKRSPIPFEKIKPLTYNPHANSNKPSMLIVSACRDGATRMVIFSARYAFWFAFRIQERDAQILKLNKERIVDFGGEQANEDTEAEISAKLHANKSEKSTAKEIEISSDGSIQVDQLKDFILEIIKDKSGEIHKSLWTYNKPYTPRIDNLKMSDGYQPPKFQQFDGKRNPRQHVAHFVETCNDVGTYEDHLVKQFVRSLKDNVFDWYTDLELNSIDSWGQLEKEFLNRFYSTRRTVSLVELTNTNQQKEESFIDYNNRWRNLSLNCKDQL
ncbi:hypothetical protein C2S52_011578 [Perilla frutescens var. hirtella]|nr:hypothetical protein C2S52_011578 [Perilla frutescens var. hirtella]